MSGCYLLDTHALLWATGTPAKLSKEARRRLEEESARILVSHATIWELSIKWTIGKIKLPDGYFESLENNGFEIMPMTDAHFSAYRALLFFIAIPLIACWSPKLNRRIFRS